MKKNEQGFTLVEIVVVVVVLALLAALSIPALSSYIAKSSDEKSQDDAKDILHSLQIKFLSLYASGEHGEKNDCAVLSKQANQAGTYNNNRFTADDKDKKIGLYDCDMHLSEQAKEILADVDISMDNDYPCSVVAIVGHYKKYANPLLKTYDPEKAYTVYGVIFQQYFKNGYFILKNDGSIIYPHSYTDLDNVLKSFSDENGQIYVQLYYIKNGKDNNNPGSTIWNTLKDNSILKKNNGKEDYIP